jgi:hypothetical protein
MSLISLTTAKGPIDSEPVRAVLLRYSLQPRERIEHYQLAGKVIRLKNAPKICKQPSVPT